MAELVDAHDSKSCGAIHESSILSRGTKVFLKKEGAKLKKILQNYWYLFTGKKDQPRPDFLETITNFTENLRQTIRERKHKVILVCSTDEQSLEDANFVGKELNLPVQAIDSITSYGDSAQDHKAIYDLLEQHQEDSDIVIIITNIYLDKNFAFILQNLLSENPDNPVPAANMDGGIVVSKN